MGGKKQLKPTFAFPFLSCVLCLTTNKDLGVSAKKNFRKTESNFEKLNKWRNAPGLLIFWAFICQQCPCTDWLSSNILYTQTKD